MVCNDEELSTMVHKYEVLYDKSHADFHRKDVKKKRLESCIRGALS